MRRSLLTGMFALALSGGAFGFAAADETVSPGAAVTAASAAASAPAAPAEARTESVPAAGSPAAATPAAAAAPLEAVSGAEAPAADDTAAPTAGADLVIRNAVPTVSPQSPAAPSRHVSRLRRFASGIVSRSSAIASSLTRSAMRFIGVPYVFGGTRTTGFDCSGYVQHVFALLGMHLPRTADAQYDAGHRIDAAMVPGDLVFFHTYAPGVSHVGIYLGKSKFIHSSSSRGVAISSLHDRYWAPRYVGAKRVFGS